jgi:Zn-dependent peptidase ImmA (M78 family)
MDGGPFTLGYDELRALTSQALAHAPKEVVDYTMDHVVMIMPLSAEKGAYIPKALFRDKDIIVFPETLLKVPEEEAYFTILHEVAHLWLEHKSPLWNMLSEEEANRQEEEANILVRQWLAN